MFESTRRLAVFGSHATAPLDGIVSWLVQELGAVAISASSRIVTFLDTFDWRCHDNDLALSCEAVAGSCSLALTLTASATGTTVQTLETPRAPRFARELPESPLRQQLTPILDVRALLPVLQVRYDTRQMAVRDHEAKTVLRIVAEEAWAAPPTHPGEEARVGVTLSLLALRGYPKAARKAAKAIQEKLGAVETADGFLAAAFGAIGRAPGGYSAKLDVALAPEMRADQALNAIFSKLLDTMEQNEAGTIADTDPEFLHDFRVAVRRSRSIFSQIKGVLPSAIAAKFSEELRWLGEVTGPTRDLDVYLITMEDYIQRLPAQVRSYLAPLIAFLREKQQAAHQNLATALKSERYARFVQQWRAYLNTPVPQHVETPFGATAVAEIARNRIWRTFRRAVKEGIAISAQSPACQLHELRITCKKLRYLLEFFQSLFPKDDMKALVTTLKALQDNLGSFQDLEVQRAKLVQLAEEMLALRGTPVRTFFAMGQLFASFEQRQQADREEFQSKFEAFIRAEQSELYRRNFGGAAVTAAEP
ncbi:MAG: CHAD domain-containing protein [Candidatus Schekmanbacteria bacterium]|nr:CHAD domain-containing protein [Candidatus Schekmanbacteria bacterium]